MKVLVVTPSYPAPDDPQGGIFIHRQLANLVRCGVTCRVLHLRPAPPPFPRWLRRRAWIEYHWKKRNWPPTVDGVSNHTVFYARRWTPGEDVVPAMQRALVDWADAHPECHHPDVVYAQFLWPGAAAALALRDRFGWPIAAMARGGELQEWYDAKPLCRQYVRDVLLEIDQTLANCAALRAAAERVLPLAEGRIQVVYNGCDANRFQPAADKDAIRRELGMSAEGRVLAFCGDLRQGKGIQDLADAWSVFASRHPEWQLVVIGKIVNRAVAARLMATGHGRVTLTGVLPETKVVKFLQAADLYVQPSWFEGLANATMEAMAVGLPVISTDVWGQRELISDGESGWLVPPRDSGQLRLALERAAADPTRAGRLGDAARAVIRTRFDPHAEASRLAGILATTALRRRLAS